MPGEVPYLGATPFCKHHFFSHCKAEHECFALHEEPQKVVTKVPVVARRWVSCHGTWRQVFLDEDLQTGPCYAITERTFLEISDESEEGS